MPKLEAASDPSMEDILASIRRIISDDDGARRNPAPRLSVVESSPAAAVAPAAERPMMVEAAVEIPAPALAPEPPVVRESVQPAAAFVRSGAATTAAAAAARMIEPAAGRAEAPETVPAAAPEIAVQPHPQPQAAENLLSVRSGAAVGEAFEQLNGAVQRRDQQTMADFVADLMRPALKEWLDDNLPALVERIVREEIERVSRGRRQG